ncbi:MAG: hypothetical protein J1E16_10840 [Muribaculaceae bacterium]|nr:hypothetical protein [Muribaculaceae bacterium]
MNILNHINSSFSEVRSKVANFGTQHLTLGILILVLCFFPSCKDDFVFNEDSSDPNNIEIEGDCIAFTMQLDRALSTRDDNNMFSSTTTSSIEKYDNYIDTQDKFRIFFFTEDGDFLFGATDRIVGSLSSQVNATSDYYYVRIPMNVIIDREGQEYDIEKIKKYLKEKPFKIAVLANWPNAGQKVNPADYDDSEFTGDFAQNPSSTLKGNPQWNWSNSILNPKIKASDIRNINDLHHVYHDVTNSDATKPDNGMSKLTTYQNFMAQVTSGDDPGWYSGEPTDWVEMRDVFDAGGWKANSTNVPQEKRYSPNDRAIKANGEKALVASIENTISSFDSKETANQWIRANWTPDWEMNQNKWIYRHYQHMWYLWNFDASYKYGAWLASNSTAKDEEKKTKADELYGDNFGFNDATTGQSIDWIVNPWGVEWFDRNGKDIYDWMKVGINSDLQDLRTLATETADKDNTMQNILKYTTISGSRMVTLNELNGILVPYCGTTEKADDNTKGCFRFRARTAGTIRVRWSSSNSSSATLNIQKNVKTSSDASNKKYETSGTTPITSEWDVSVGEDAFPMYVYCSSGNVVIYSIEYIRGKYLYDTDRQGRLPNQDQAIPMYGVQRYAPIPSWERGTTHNLDGNVYMVRALAKVEVYISKDFGELQHVYMKSMNRAARCEPMDVETPTSDLWNNLHYDITNNKELCEWYNIQKYGACYNIDQSKYINWLNWFYDSWTSASWKTAGYTYRAALGYWVPTNADGKHTGWPKTLTTLDEFTTMNGTKLDSPHLFNPYIYRSDFCRFIAAGEDDNYYKFILYVPDKNIDDPSTVGRMDSTPKVPHIEYRFKPNATSYPNSEFNLDDNDCYRIYFTNYGQYSASGSENMDGTPLNTKFANKTIDQDDYDNYEKDRTNLSYHWPVMRNHLYQFYVGGSSPENPIIEVRVSDWSHKKVVVEW